METAKVMQNHMFKNITLIVNESKEDARRFAELLRSCFPEEVSLHAIYQNNYGPEALKETELLIVLGGDGTILQAAQALRGREIPILGINIGHLGYLTELSLEEEIRPSMKKVMAGEYTLESRTMLFGRAIRGGEEIARGLSLNEVLLSRREGVRILRFFVESEGADLGSIAADGLIVATPTGSTAYNLSAGGPVASPDAPIYLMTPICAHAFRDQSIIFPDRKRLLLTMESDNAMLSFDGDCCQGLRRGDQVEIRRAREKVILCKIKNESFVKILREKMSGGHG